MKKQNSLGTVLKTARKRNNLSIKNAAPKLEIDYSYLSKIENDHKLPSTELISKLCELYGEDYDKITALIGGLPNDIQEIIREYGPEVFDLIRKTYNS